MATAAHAVSNQDVAASDMMDLHSDSGLDFDDGDIELDIDPAPPAEREDDDVSIGDAASDGGIHSQTVVDQDDFMTDNEDYGEFNMQYNGAEEDQKAASSAQAAALQEQTYTSAPPDDDLIDYSDEEEDDQTPTAPAQAEAQAPGSVRSGNNTAKHEDHVHEQDDVENETNDQEQHFGDDFEAANQADEHTDGEDGGVQLQNPVSEADTNDQHHDSPEEQRSIESRAITVNYEGNELWLFKQHDTEDSGDWLIDNLSLLHSSLSELFQACRLSLGEDISNETELGLRFDHLHNMELYEDNTACVAVSLERLVELYYTLHAQDGESDPESFYMCLLSRPRFATLLSDVAKHAEQGSGYSGLNTAVAAGETHFADAYSGHSTEHEGTEWDNEEGAYNEEQQEDAESASEADHGVELAEHENPDAMESGGDEQANIHETETTEHKSASSPRSFTHSDQEAHSGENAKPQKDAEDGQKFTQSGTPSQATQQASQPAKSEREEQLANDTVDFSDDDDDDAPQTKTTNAASPSSATVQAEYPATGEASNQTVESTNLEDPEETEDNTRSGYDDATNSAQNDDFDGLAQTQEQIGHDDNTESYQDYNQVYDQGDPFKEFQVDGPDAYPAEPDFDGLTNQEYPGYDYQDLDQQLENDFITGADLDGVGAGESTNAATDFADGDDFLDLDNAPEWATDQEPASTVPEETILVHDEVTAQHEEEEEDGVVEQPAVAASSAADPVATSSADLQETSPQGQKRSIDEVGDSVGDALDLTDMKRPRV